MTNINPINVNSQGIGNAYGHGAKQKKAEEQKEEALQAAPGQQKQVSADEILSFMAQAAVTVAPKTAVDPSKYVDKESEARIAGFMAGFEDVVAANLTAIASEFPGMSEDGKMALALAGVNKGI